MARVTGTIECDDGEQVGFTIDGDGARLARVASERNHRWAKDILWNMARGLPEEFATREEDD